MVNRGILTEAERLEIYLKTLPIPHPTTLEMDQVLTRPCKWAKILEERSKDPDGTG